MGAYAVSSLEIKNSHQSLPMLIGFRDTGFCPSISQGRRGLGFRSDPDSDAHVAYLIRRLIRDSSIIVFS